MPEQIWDRDIEYNADLVKNLARSHLDFKVDTVELLGEGFDNTVFLLNGTEVLRLVRREEGLAFANCERVGLPLLPSDLVLEIPRVRKHGKYLGKWDWFLHKKIPGHPIYFFGTNGDERSSAAPKIAKFLKQLHSVPIGPFAQAGLPGDWMGHMNLAKRIPFAEAKLKILVDSGVIENRNEYAALIGEVSKLSTDGHKCVVHGDFKATHIMFEFRNPVGVIDWGDIHIGHPSTDLSIAYTFFTPKGRRIFMDHYGSVDESVWKLAKFRAFFHTLGILEYTTFTCQADLTREAQRALQWTFADC